MCIKELVERHFWPMIHKKEKCVYNHKIILSLAVHSYLSFNVFSTSEAEYMVHSVLEHKEERKKGKREKKKHTSSLKLFNEADLPQNAK